jgi:hypothetical protein
MERERERERESNNKRLMEKLALPRMASSNFKPASVKIRNFP